MDQLQTRLDALEQQTHTVNVGSAGGGGWPAAWSCWRCSPGCCRPCIAQEDAADKRPEGAGAAGGGPGDAPQAFQPRGQ